MKTDFTVIDFSADGSVVAMDRPQFQLGFLGKQKIERASDLRFDEVTQLWDIWVHRDNDTYAIVATVSGSCGFPSYEVARAVEVAWFEQCRLDSVSPLCQEGIAILLEIRNRFPCNK